MEEGMIRGSYESLIFEFRGYKVMVDSDLAALYETETKILKQQVYKMASSATFVVIIFYGLMVNCLLLNNIFKFYKIYLKF